MPVNYGLYQQTNSNLVPQKRMFPVEAYMRTVEQRDSLAAQTEGTDMYTADVVSQGQALPQDANILGAVQQSAMQTIALRSSAPEEMWTKVNEAKMQAIKYQRAVGTLSGRVEAVQKDIEGVKAKRPAGWNDADLQRYEQALLYSQNPAYIDNMGNVRAGFTPLSTVEKPEMMSLVDEAMKNARITKRGKDYLRENPATGAYRIDGVKYEILPPEEVANIVSKAIAANGKMQAWSGYNSNVHGILYGHVNYDQIAADPRYAGLGTERKGVDPKTKKEIVLPSIIETYKQQGKSPAQLLADMETQQMTNAGLEYALSKYPVNNIDESISSYNNGSEGALARAIAGQFNTNPTEVPQVFGTSLPGDFTGMEGGTFESLQTKNNESLQTANAKLAKANALLAKSPNNTDIQATQALAQREYDSATAEYKRILNLKQSKSIETAHKVFGTDGATFLTLFNKVSLTADEKKQLGNIWSKHAGKLKEMDGAFNTNTMNAWFASPKTDPREIREGWGALIAKQSPEMTINPVHIKLTGADKEFAVNMLNDFKMRGASMDSDLLDKEGRQPFDNWKGVSDMEVLTAIPMSDGRWAMDNLITTGTGTKKVQTRVRTFINMNDNTMRNTMLGHIDKQIKKLYNPKTGQPYQDFESQKGMADLIAARGLITGEGGGAEVMQKSVGEVVKISPYTNLFAAAAGMQIKVGYDALSENNTHYQILDKDGNFVKDGKGNLMVIDNPMQISSTLFDNSEIIKKYIKQ